MNLGFVQSGPKRKLENYNYAKKPGKSKSTSSEGVRD
jgi:hypothetical protein